MVLTLCWHAQETGWEDGVLEAFAGMLEAGLLATNSKYSRGLKWFVAEQYFPMLAEADNESATMPTVAILIRPWLLLLSKENDKIFRGKVCACVGCLSRYGQWPCYDGSRRFNSISLTRPSTARPESLSTWEP